MVEAYVLINCDSGKAGEAVRKIREIQGLKNAKLVTGLHDIVALAEAEDLKKLAQVVVDKIQRVDGVSRTVTMVAVDL